MGICESDQVGKLIVDKQKYDGQHKYLLVPSEGEFEYTVPPNIMGSHAGAGRYTLLMSNCDDNGRDVQLSGKVIWRSHGGGYLPGDLFEEWHFAIFLSFCYGALLILYAVSMRINKDSTIEIQKWILCTVFLGFIQIVFEAIDYTIWNQTGVRSTSILYFCKRFFHPFFFKLKCHLYALIFIFIFVAQGLLLKL